MCSARTGSAFDEETLFLLGEVIEQAAGRFTPARWGVKVPFDAQAFALHFLLCFAMVCR
jgi:hypothetical protein